MPLFNETDLRNLIAENRVGAVSLDTSVFDRYECNLRSQALLSLRQFRGAETQFIVSQVVIGEVKAHINERASASRLSLDSALNQVRKRWHREIDNGAVYQFLGLLETPCGLADTLFADFVDAVQPVVVDIDGSVRHEEVLRRYFSSEPPFSQRESKKNEFPDALALLSLEAWGRARNTTVLVVSSDQDWQKYADGSERLICVPDLPTALDYFHQEAGFVARRAVGLLRQALAPELHEAIDTAIQSYLDSFDPGIEAYTFFEYEIDNLEHELQHWEVALDAPKVLNADDEAVVFSIKVDATVRFEADFIFSIHDSIDKDYVPLGSDSRVVEQTIKLSLVASIDREINLEPIPNEIAVTTHRIVVKFGNINPDWGDPEEP